MQENKRPIDLVELFYKEKIDLDKFFGKGKINSSKRVKEFSLEPFNGELNTQQKSHLLRRALVGISKRHFDDIADLNFDEIFDLLFTNENLEEPTNNYYFKKTNEDWIQMYGRDDVGPGETFVNNASTERNTNQEYENGDWVRRESIQGHILSNIYEQNTSVHWKLFLFLHNLVPTDGGQGVDNKGLWNYYKLIFDSCFENYKEFIYNITLNPAMLVYLNLNASRKETPDENYAREVQELFTVGKRPFSMFTEEDVREAARLLVGFSVNYETLFKDEEVSHNIDQWNHDTGDKQFSSFYGNKRISGRDTQNGMLEELSEFVDMLFYPKQTKLYIARRLYQFFVNPTLTDEIEKKVVEPLSKIFESSNYSLTYTLKVLLKSKHFFDEANYFSIIKSPFDLIFGLSKELDIINGTVRNYDAENQGNFNIPERISIMETRKFTFYNSIKWTLFNMGMEIGKPPSVSGWPPYYQEPVYDMFWINSVTLKSKIQFVEGSCRWGIWMEDGFNLVVDKIKYLFTYANHNDIDLLLDEMTERLLCKSISNRDKNRIVLQSLNGASKVHWKQIINNYKNGSEQVRDDYKWEIESVFERIMYQVFSLGEYNLH
jgi:uncharacterized protein (DUF1800 family)